MSLTTQFLSSIRGFIKKQDGVSLRAWLRVESDSSPQYFQLAEELRTGFASEDAVARLVEKCMPLDDGDGGAGATWPSLVAFLKEYMHYWREVNFDDIQTLYPLLSTLLVACSTAFSHPSGSLLLETCVALSESLAQLVMVVHHRPDLVSHMRSSGGDDEERKSPVESTADVIQKMCTACLSEKSINRFARPEGRRLGFYRLVNLVLRLLFAGDKARWAAQTFTNISSMGPPLDYYPAAQRVTYLYYLGRFYLENNHFSRATLCLEAAYLQTPPHCQRHRRLILTFLIPSKLLIGVFPTASLLSRPEAAGELRAVFAPMAAAVRQGNFAAFQATLREHEAWLVRHRLHLTLAYRLRPLLWRSLARRTFLLTYVPPSNDVVVQQEGGAGRGRAAPVLDLADLLTAAVLAQHQIEGYTVAPRQRPPHINTLFRKAVENSTDASTLAAPLGGVRKLRPSEGLVWGNMAVTMADVESVVSSLVAQGLMHGFVAHAASKFAVVGAKAKGSAILAGWPPVAEVIRERLLSNDIDITTVPAWVRAP